MAHRSVNVSMGFSFFKKIFENFVEKTAISGTAMS